MNIGIDASYLTPELTGGMQEYLKYVIQNLSLLDTKNIYTIYFKFPITSDYFNKLTNNNPNFSYKCLKTIVSWEQVSLPIELFKNKVDILFCIWHTIPILHPKSLKIVSVIHDLDFSSKYMLAPYYTCLKSDLLVAVSSYTKNAAIKKFKMSGDKINVIYEGVDLDKFTRASKETIKETLSKYNITNPYLFFIGTLGPRKNIHNMLRAYALYIKKYPNSDIGFVIAGRCMSGYEDIYTVPKQLGISKNVKFLGKISEKDLISLYSNACALLYVSNSEGFGLPVLEAMACECPVITSNTSALLEVAKDSALLVSPKDVQKISISIENVLNDNVLRQMMIEDGKKNVKHFTWEKTSLQLLECFRKIK